MIFISAFTVILYAVLCVSQICGAAISQATSATQISGFQLTVDQTPLAATCTPKTTVKVFAAILYIDLVSAHDPEVVFGLSWPSDIASKRYYQEKLRVFTEIGLPDPEELASFTASALLLADEFTIDFYYFAAALTYGEFLYEKGFLTCDNVIQVATKYFEYEQKEFESLDSDVFEASVGAILLSFEDLLESLGYTVEENVYNWKIETELFYIAYSTYAAYIHDRSWWAHF